MKHKRSRIYAIGESAYDILFKNDKPYDGKVGGAVINTAVSLGRMNTDVYLVGDIADDKIGKITLNFLEENKVKTEYFRLNPYNQSRISLAFIDNPNQPHYLFYKLKGENNFQLTFPVDYYGDIILFGSLYSVRPDYHFQIFNFLQKAQAHNSLIYYDPNFRKNHLNILPEIIPNLLKNIEISDIIKGSDEDFHTIFGCKNFEETVFKIDASHKKILIYTRGKKSLKASVFGKFIDLKIDEVETKSAVGAGDSFNAGFVWELYNRNICKNNYQSISIDVWSQILRSANRFAAHVCTRDENYISTGFADSINQEFKE